VRADGAARAGEAAGATVKTWQPAPCWGPRGLDGETVGIDGVFSEWGRLSERPPTAATAT
jgi:hypothetical protein